MQSFQLKHCIYLTIVVVTVIMINVVSAMPKVKPIPLSTRNITRIGKGGNKDVTVSTRYITTQTTELKEKTSKRFIVALCDEFQGQAIQSTIILHTNYRWNPSKGVVYYYIVDDPNKTEKDALCSNTKQGTVPAVSTCTISSFTSSSNTLYLVTSVGTHDASFSIDLDIAPSTKTFTKYNLKDMKTRKANGTSNHDFHLNNAPDEYLTEVITTENSVVIDVEETALLSVTFCPKPQTNKYNIESSVISANGASSFTQYICDKLPCVVDGANIIKENKQQVPKNEITLGPETTGKLKLYILVVCWAGVPDPDVPSGIAGEFIYNGEIQPIQ